MYIRLKRPTDIQERILFTYILPNDCRLRLDLAPHPTSVVQTLLGTTTALTGRSPKNFCKIVHRYTHATEHDMRELCKDADILDPALDAAIKAVCDACKVCAKNGLPKSSRKVSLSHVNEAFNQEIQIDFLFFCIEKH